LAIFLVLFCGGLVVVADLRVKKCAECGVNKESFVKTKGLGEEQQLRIMRQCTWRVAHVSPEGCARHAIHAMPRSKEAKTKQGPTTHPT
jgi:hypothetical protein